ncbi:hypothetical protein [Kitasatospora sp. NPDC015120]|uniref:hypothetical protein n=1 Tax=Kitasatospora sp. NPDC015120 TaxID=3364023 RepID=UPI0036F46D53
MTHKHSLMGKIAAVTIGIAAASLALTTPASARPLTYAEVWHGDDFARANDNHVFVFDGESDGNGVYADFWLANGQHLSQWDGSGHDAYGSDGYYAANVTKIRVCEDHTGCSGWKNL